LALILQKSPCLAEKTLGRFLKGPEMKGKRIAFDDDELADWLIDLIADGPENFLQALAEAVVTADAHDYGIIRPALIELRRRHGGRAVAQARASSASALSAR
jgi:hypothetical protein